jgi:4-carboxymuconolactone decarboxylase
MLMRLAKPRLAPTDWTQWNDEQKETFKGVTARGAPLNIFKTLAHHPKAARAYLRFGNHVLSRDNTLPARERELVILRVGYLCKSGYEFTQHAAIGLRAGLTQDEIERLKKGADEPGWSPADKALLKATDDLHTDYHISDAVWGELKNHFVDQQLVDLVFTVGQYTQTSMMLNTLGVQLDEGQTLDPDLKK